MELKFSQEDLEFKKEVRQFFENKLPADIKDRCERGLVIPKEMQVRWQKILFDQGWMAPNWPVDEGGTGWSLTQKYIFAQEAAAACAPPPMPFGVNMIGPVLIKYGTEAQQQKHLPNILNSDTWWCQGYSEPGSGSDLASLKTKAVKDGNDYVINGQKIWTSYAQYADMMFCLVRTDPDAKKQEGISFLLIDMNTPGIEVKPIIGLDLNHTLNEVFFTDVRVPIENLVGEENSGWTYAKSLLEHERSFIARVANSKQLLVRLKQIASTQRIGDNLLINNPDFRRKLTAVEIDLMALEYSELRFLAKQMDGGQLGPEPSIMKLEGSQIQQRLKKLLVESLGMYALPFDADARADESDYLAMGPEHAHGILDQHFYGRSATLVGGTSEVQKNVISRLLMKR